MRFLKTMNEKQGNVLMENEKENNEWKVKGKNEGWKLKDRDER